MPSPGWRTARAFRWNHPRPRPVRAGAPAWASTPSGRARASVMGRFASLTTTRRAFVTTAVAAPLVARAETSWPSKPIRIVVPFNAGGPIDALARLIADGLVPRLGQQMLVDPRPGANTIVGSE